MYRALNRVHDTGDSRRAKRYFPFAEGARSCVGQALAKTSMTATLALLLSRFSFKLAAKVSLLGHILKH